MNLQQKLAIRFIRAKINLLSVISKRKAGEEAFRIFCTPTFRYKGKESEVFKSATALHFLLDGKNVKGYVCNAGAPKRALILHGFSSTCHKFDKYAAALVQKNYEVLAFDAPAHGASEGSSINAVEYSNLIKKVVELYGKVALFIGHSFGGIAISLAMEELQHDATTKVVLIAPATETSSAIEGAFILLGLHKPSIKKALYDVIFNISGKPVEWFSIRRAMNNIQASVLWIHDEDDDVTPMADARRAEKDERPNVRFLFTKGLGHQKIYRDAAVKKAVIDFAD
jgi:pimeloyl-ACP methyl ester carboxylesterase